MNKTLLTISQASKFLNVHPDTLRRWEKEGQIESIRIGNRRDRRYELESLNKIINSSPEIDNTDTIDVGKYSENLNKAKQLIRQAKGVIFDLGDTLMTVYPSRGYIFAEYAYKYGYLLNPDAIERNWFKLYEEWEKERIISKIFYSCNEKEYETLYAKLNANILHFSGIPKEKHKEAIDIGRSIFLEILQNPSRWKIIPYVKEILSKLKSENKKIALLANWNSDLKTFIYGSEISIYFDVIVSGTSNNLKKPGKEIFIKTLDELSLKSSEVIHIGDSMVDDVTGARNTSIIPILYDRTRTVLNKDFCSFYQYKDLL